jgi:hypothetical protein
VLVVDAAPTKPKADEPKADEPKPGTPGGNCCCCPKGLDLNRFTYQGDMFGTHSGHNWDPKVDLDYTPAAAKQSCDMEWWEKTNRPYSEVPAFDTWTRITNPKAGSIEHWDKRKEPCPGKESVYLTDPPSVPHDGKQGNTYTRVLEFRIRVTSGCPSCGEKRGTAVQTLVVEDGKVNEKKSSFLTPNPKDQWADEVKPDDKKP